MSVVLETPRIRLESLDLQRHVDGLTAAVSDGQLWKLWYTWVPRPECLTEYLEAFAVRRERGEVLPFVVWDLSIDRVVGFTAFYEIDTRHRRLAIGHTWYAASAQRTAINTEAKWLLLRHAFEELRCVRVEFHTHWLNQRSRKAIERLGAKQEGVLRNHRIMPDGSVGDTVMFSIIESEWPAIKQHLLYLMNAYSHE